jgi:hypothetical protein
MNSSQNLRTIRVGLIISIIAGLSVGALNGFKVREKIRQLQSGLREQTAARQSAEKDLAGAKSEIQTALATLTRTKADLQDANLEKEKALATAAAQNRKAEQLAKDLKSSEQQYDHSQAHLMRYQATGMEPEQISRAAELIRKLQNDLGVAQAINKNLNIEIATLKEHLAGEFAPVKLPAGLDSKVLVYDPRWKFVVLDAGENQGVLEDGELLVSRAGELVAKVVVTRVEKDRCVASVKPGWRIGEILEGDRAIPAHPKS